MFRAIFLPCRHRAYDGELGSDIAADRGLFLSAASVIEMTNIQAATHKEQKDAPETLLGEWLRESDNLRAQALLGALLSSYAEPLLRRIVGYKVSQPADIDDICSNAIYNLIARLQKLKDQQMPGVRSFSGYVAVTAYNACNEYFRALKPAWLRLAMRVRYALTHSSQLALWETPDGQEICGFPGQRGEAPASDFAALAEASGMAPRSADPRLPKLTGLIETLLKFAKGPVTFEQLVEAAAECSGVKESRLRSLDDQTRENLADDRPMSDARLIGRAYMHRLWYEIRQLPVEHRKALLLNLKDSAGGDIQLFDWLGIASIREIALALEMDPVVFAELWKELPLEDARIARELGISRQDVVNRRSSARKRLARRMKEMGGAV